MQNSILLLIVLAIGIGLLIGFLILSSIALIQGRQRIDSLIQLPELVGKLATVEVPFDHHQVGKIRVTAHGKTLRVNAKTDLPQIMLQPGDVVLILEVQQTIAWVMPEANLYR